MVEVIIDIARCTGCGACVDVCPEDVFDLHKARGRKTSKAVAEDLCFACRACEVRCSERAIQVTGFEILKVVPPLEYPPEKGRFLRGNDYSPVAVVAILDTYDFKIPPELVRIIEVAIENGAALAGTKLESMQYVVRPGERFPCGRSCATGTARNRLSISSTHSYALFDSQLLSGEKRCEGSTLL